MRYILRLFSILFILQFAILNGQSSIDVSALPSGVSIHQLDNGMQVLLVENPALPMVGVNVVVKVGSAYESFATSGMSHMLEHLLFNGTTTRTQKELYYQTDMIGGYNNANTSDYYTNYMMVTPAEHIEKGMELQADMLFNSVLPEEKFDKEKGIVLEEIARSLTKPEEQIERNVLSVLYQGHALSLPTLGTYSTIKGMTRDEVYEFYKNNYVPNNMIMSVIGNFRTSKMLSSINEVYGKAKPSVISRELAAGWSSGFDTADLKLAAAGQVYQRFYKGENQKVQLYFAVDNQPGEEVYNLTQLVLDRETHQIEAKLKEISKTTLKSIKLSTRLSPVQNYVVATLTLQDASNLNSIIDATAKELATLNFKLGDESVTNEVSKARTSFLKNIEKPHMFGIYNAFKFAVGGIERVLASYEGKGYLLAAEKLNKFKITGFPFVVVHNPLETETKDAELSELYKEMISQEADAPQLIVVQNTGSNLLAIHYLIKHKKPLESKFGKDAAQVLHDCIEQRLESDENKQKSNQFGLTFVVNDNPFIPMDNIYLHPDFGYIRVEGLADDVASVIEFLNSQLLTFTPSETEFQKAVGKMKRSGPMMMGGNMAKKMFEKSYEAVIYEMDTFQDAPELTYENLLAFSKEYFQPANMIISVVSPKDSKSIQSYFSTFKGGNSLSAGVYQKQLQVPTDGVQIEKQGGGEQSYLFWGFVKEVDPAEKAAVQALSLVLADRIIFDIREKQGMAYRMKAGITLQDDKALFNINMGTRPANLEQLLPQLPNFFKLDFIQNLTEEEVQKSITMYLGRMMFRRLSSINQAYYLGHSLYFKNDINYDSQFLDNLKQVKLNDVMSAAKKYMQADNVVEVLVR